MKTSSTLFRDKEGGNLLCEYFDDYIILRVEGETMKVKVYRDNLRRITRVWNKNKKFYE